MKKLFVIILFFPLVSFSQKNCTMSLSDKWDCLDYAHDMAVEEAKFYLRNKLLEFKKFCKTDSLLIEVKENNYYNGQFKDNCIYYYKEQRQPTFEYFIEWISKNN